MTADPTGTIFAGKYRIDGVLGEGGMGVVVAATHVALARQVAIKFLRPEVTGNREVVERMMREARASALLRSEHVAQVIDVGTENGLPYIVLELLIGEDLAAVLARGPLAPVTAVHYILQAAEALAEAHAARIVHRDLKPQNLFLTQRAADGAPLVKVLDFGISKADLGEVSSLTATGAVIGTPAYMPPEQLRSTRAVDPRGDIWALGVCLYELIAGRRPFEGETFAELCLKIGIDPPRPLTTPRGVDLGGLEAVVMRCLRKDPADRYQTIVELAAALAPFGGETGWEQYQHCIRLSGAPGAPSHQVTTAKTLVVTAPTTMRQAMGQVGARVKERKRSGWEVRIAAAAFAAAILAMVGLRIGRDDDGLRPGAENARPRVEMEPRKAPPRAAPAKVTPALVTSMPTAPATVIPATSPAAARRQPAPPAPTAQSHVTPVEESATAPPRETRPALETSRPANAADARATKQDKLAATPRPPVRPARATRKRSRTTERANGKQSQEQAPEAPIEEDLFSSQE